MDPDGIAWIAVLAVVAAPLFEEFIFRGLIYRGMRRSSPPVAAVLLSAALFAIVHPPISVVPVFFLGVSAALALEFTGTLLAPVLVHVVYNAAVLAAS
jgi:membrane protease YdiL (CAAX protease family)